MRSVGIDIGSAYLKYAIVEDEDGGVRMLDSGSIRITDSPLRVEGDLRLRLVEKAVSEFVEEVELPRGCKINVSFSGFMTQARIVELPPGAGRKAKGILEFEARSMTASGHSEDFSFSGGVLRNNSENRGIACAGRTSEIEEHLEILTRRGISPDAILPEPLALLSLPELADIDDDELRVILDIGAKYSRILFMHGGTLIRIHQIPMGCGQAVRVIERKAGISHEEASLALNNWLNGNKDTAEESKDDSDAPLEFIGLDDVEVIDDPFADDIDSEQRNETAESLNHNKPEIEKEAKPEKDGKLDSALKRMERDFRGIFLELNRLLGAIKREEGVAKAPLLMMTGIACNSSLRRLAEEAIPACKVQTLNALAGVSYSGLQNEVQTFSATALGLAAAGLSKHDVVVNMLPEEMSLKRERGSRGWMTWAAAAMLVLIPVPSILSSGEKLAQVRKEFEAERKALEQQKAELAEEAELDAKEAKIKKDLAPLRYNAFLQDGYANILPFVDSRSEGKVWLKEITATAMKRENVLRSLSRGRRRAVENKADSSGRKPPVIACTIAMEAEKYSDVDEFAERLKSSPGIENFQLKKAEDFSEEKAGASLTVGEIEKYGSGAGGRYVMARMSFELE